VNEPRDRSAAGNPFRSSRIRPGAVPFFFPPGQTIDALVERLRQNAWRGEIVGPHGSGKSTLLASLIPALQRAGRPTTLIALHDGQRRLPAEPFEDASIAPGTVLIVDGYEQLNLWNRRRLRRFRRRHGLGLIVTAHRSVGLPPLYRTEVDAKLARAVVVFLLGDRQEPPAERIDRLLDKHRGNLRETLFDLYDDYA